MKIQITDTIWLNESGTCSIEHLAEVSGLSLAEVHDLVERGVIAPVDERARPPSFHLQCIVAVKTARRLRDDFELDPNGTALALALLRRIHELEAKLQAERARSGRGVQIS